MATQDEKFLLTKLKEISTILGCHVKVRSTITKGFTFIPDKVSVPDAFCLLQESKLEYHTMRLCQAKGGQYWIEITFSNIPYRMNEFWNGKKFVEYK